jgi:hypothetical protein
MSEVIIYNTEDVGLDKIATVNQELTVQKGGKE